MVSVLQSLGSKIKQALPGVPNYVTAELKLFKWPNTKRPTEKPKKTVVHEKGRKFEGYPGQYEQSPFTHVFIGPLHLFIHWKPFDHLSEEEYREKYGTYGPLGETKWERKKREENEARKRRLQEDKKS
jgi:hypothetical protein